MARTVKTEARDLVVSRDGAMTHHRQKFFDPFRFLFDRNAT